MWMKLNSKLNWMRRRFKLDRTKSQILPRNVWGGLRGRSARTANMRACRSPQTALPSSRPGCTDRQRLHSSLSAGLCSPYRRGGGGRADRNFARSQDWEGDQDPSPGRAQACNPRPSRPHHNPVKRKAQVPTEAEGKHVMKLPSQSSKQCS